MLVFIDDILVYSANRLAHKEYLKTVLEVLGVKKLFAKLSNSAFWLGALLCLGHVVSKDGIAGDPKKIEDIVEWERPTSVRLIRSLLGFGGHKQRFTEGFYTLLGPLTALTWKNGPHV